MRKSLLSSIFILAIMGIGFNASAQFMNQYDVAIGFAGGQRSLSLSAQKQFSIGAKQRLKLNLGLRFSTIGFGELEYYSAPIDYFLIPEKTDTLVLSNSGQNNLAIMLGASYLIKNKIELGFNIDAVGYTFGQSRTATFNPQGANITDEVSPNQITALLVGANDIGMVKAEFFGAYRINDKLAIRLGLANSFVEYKTSTELQTGNDRFRGISSMPFVAARITL
ncbi:MAG: hypothetical protein ACPGLV_19085 [Bacteroidia bacterium]